MRCFRRDRDVPIDAHSDSNHNNNITVYQPNRINYSKQRLLTVNRLFGILCLGESEKEKEERESNNTLRIIIIYHRHTKILPPYAVVFRVFQERGHCRARSVYAADLCQAERSRRAFWRSQWEIHHWVGTRGSRCHGRCRRRQQFVPDSGAPSAGKVSDVYKEKREDRETTNKENDDADREGEYYNFHRYFACLTVSSHA